MEITFDEATHQYWIDGAPAISVTTLLKDFGLINSSFFTPESRDRGTAVHKATELIDKGLMDVAEFEGAPHFGFIRAYADFCEKTGFVAHEIEKRVGNAAWGICGTLDRVGTLNGRPLLLDLKTGGKYATHGLQTAAYNLLDGNLSTRDRACLHIKADGKWKLESHTDNLDYSTFAGMANLRLWKIKAGLR